MAERELRYPTVGLEAPSAPAIPRGRDVSAGAAGSSRRRAQSAPAPSTGSRAAKRTSADMFAGAFKTLNDIPIDDVRTTLQHLEPCPL